MIEKVNPSHPDKIADRIAGAIVDMAYAKERNPRIAVEVLIGHGICHFKFQGLHLLFGRKNVFESRSQNIFYCTLIALPTALLVQRKPKMQA